MNHDNDLSQDSTAVSQHTEISQQSVHFHSNGSSPAASSSHVIVQAHRRHFFETVFRASAQQIITSPAAYREQLFSTFVNELTVLYDMPSRYSLLSRLRDWFEPRCDSGVIATDCLLLLHFARVTGDNQVLFEGKRRHYLAIHCLKAKLASPAATNDDTLLVSMDALGICHLYEQEPRRKHAQGLRRLLEVRGPGAMQSVTGLTRDLVFNALHINLIACMTSRTACMFGEPRWSRALETSCNGRVWCLFRLACRIPAALARIDTIGSASKSEVAALLSQLVSLGRQFQEWLLIWYEEIIGPPIRSAPWTDSPQWTARYGSSSLAFPQAFSFPTFPVALGHLTYWAMLLPLREAIYTLATHPQAAQLTTPAYHKVLFDATDECADSICRMAPFMLTNTEVPKGGARSLYGALLPTLKWYQRSGQVDKVAFCQTILATQDRVSAASLEHIDWVDVDGFLMRRLMWQNVIGPSRCIKRRTNV